MSRRVLIPACLALLVLLALVACGRAGPDPAAVARAVDATLTASAPRVESTVASALGPTAEVLLTREATRTTGDTSTAPVAAKETLEPSAVGATLTPEAAGTPPPWHDYANPAGTFTLFYPDTWKIASQLVNRVTFGFQPNGVANVDVINTADATGGLRDALSSADGIARYAMEDQAGRYVTGAVEKGVWTGEPPGYFALLDVNDYGLVVQWLYVAIPRDKSHAVLAKVALVDGKVTQEQRETLGKILASVQLAGIATPAPQAQATPEPTQAPPTQAPPAQSQPQPTQAPPAPAQPRGTPQVATDQSVNLRSGPGTRYMVKAITQPGQKYDLVGQNQEGTWYQICCVAGEKLWISKLVAIVSGDATSIAVVEAPANPTTAPAAEATPTPGP